VEYSFSVLKTDLELRPIYHKRDQLTLAHLHLAIPACWVAFTAQYQLKNKGIHHEWSELLWVMKA